MIKSTFYCDVCKKEIGPDEETVVYEMRVRRIAHEPYTFVARDVCEDCQKVFDKFVDENFTYED